MTNTEHADEAVRHEVTGAIWAGAERAVGMPRAGSAAWRTWHEDPDAQIDIHLHAVRLAAHVGLDAQPWVTNAREAGATWEQIGATLDVTRQAAQQRYGRDDRWTVA